MFGWWISPEISSQHIFFFLFPLLLNFNAHNVVSQQAYKAIIKGPLRNAEHNGKVEV